MPNSFPCKDILWARYGECGDDFIFQLRDKSLLEINLRDNYVVLNSTHLHIFTATETTITLLTKLVEPKENA